MVEVDKVTGEIIFSTEGELGTSDVAKLEVITAILKELLSTLTIKVDSSNSDQDLNEFKEEIMKLLEAYAKIEQINNLVSEKISSMLADGTLPSTDSLKEEMNQYSQEVGRLTLIVEGDGVNSRGLVGLIEDTLLPKINHWETTVLKDFSDKINKFEQDNDTFRTDLNLVKKQLNLLLDLDLLDVAEFAKDIKNINTKLATIGDTSKLSTESKDDLVSAINEVFQSASNLKSIIATAITGRGITAESTESAQSLADKIGDIKSDIELVAISEEETLVDLTDVDTWVSTGEMSYSKGGLLIIQSLEVLDSGVSLESGYSMRVLVDGEVYENADLGSSIKFDSTLEVQLKHNLSDFTEVVGYWIGCISHYK